MVKNILFRYIVSVWAVMALSNVAMASNAADYFRTKQSGNWNDINTWESSSNNLIWSNATLTPDAAASKIQIRNGHTATVTANVTVDDVEVDAGATVDVLSDITLTIANGTAVTDFGVSGIVRNAGTISPAGTLVFYNNGLYQHTHTVTGGAIPIATWEDGSDCQIVGFVSTSSHITLANNNYSFYNFTWNCPNQTTNTAPTLSHRVTVRNNFLIISTGNGLFRLAVSTANTYSIVNNFIQIGGVFNIINGNGGGNSVIVVKDFMLSGGIFQKGTGSSIGKVIFNGATKQNISLTGGVILGPIEFIINPNAVVDFGNSMLPSTATGIFTVNNGATLITAHPQGIALTGTTGTIQSTGARTFSPNANYIYNGTAAQQTGTGLPASVNNLTIDNSAGVTLRPGSLTVNGDLAIQSGYLDLGTNALITSGSVGLSGNGTLRTQNTSANPLSAGKTWNGMVEYNGSTAQNIIGGQYNNLQLSGGAKALTGNIAIGNNFDVAGASTVNMGTYKVSYNGSASQDVAGIPYYDLEIGGAGTKTIAAPATVSNNVTVSNAVLDANGNLTLLAGSNTNANIGPLSGSADVVGNVHVQSFMSGAGNGGIRGTRTMSSPINDALTSGAKTFAQLKSQMIVTGAGGTANGFDAVPAGVSNANIVFTYNNSLTAPFVPLANIAVPLNQGSGFIYFFMGNRDNKDSNPGKLISPFIPAEDVTLTYTGIINKGDIDIPITYNASKTSMQGAFVAGNPYPAVIDWNAVYGSSTNIGSTITVVVGGKANATYNTLTGYSINGGSRYIQPGQGFYVYAGNGGGVLKFRESHKNIEEEPARLLSVVERPQLIAAKEKVAAGKLPRLLASPKAIKMQLESGPLKEEALVAFAAGFDAKSDKDDSPYITGYALNLATLSSDNKLLGINLLPDAESVEEVKLAVGSNSSGNMKLNFTDIPTIADRQLFLKDNYLNSEKLITPEDNSYEFYIDKNTAASYGSERFVLALEPAKVLPVVFSEFKVTKKNFGSELQWTAASERHSGYFEIERSSDGSVFEAIGKVQLAGNTVAGKSYYFVDGSPVQGINYYRIKQIDIDGKAVYTAIKQLDFSGWSPEAAVNKLVLYPNPVEKAFTIDIYTDKAVELSIIDMAGRRQSTIHFAQHERIVFDASNLAAGNYITELRTKGTGELLGYGKFVKK